MTEITIETIRLIHKGGRDLQIATELNDRYGVPGHEHDFFGPIQQCRAEIEAFRREAPALALEAFRRGYSWQQVVAGLEAKGLLSSSELIHICVVARDTVFPKTAEENKHVDDVLSQQRQLLDNMNKQMIEAAHALAAQVEGTADPALRNGVDAFQSMIDANEQDREDNRGR